MELVSNKFKSRKTNRILHLHIGRHKTGTTSFQNFLSTNQLEFGNHDIELFCSSINLNPELKPVLSWAHEMPLVLLRPEFEFVLRLITKDLNLDVREMSQNVFKHLQSKSQHVIASHEALSYARKPEELNKLKRWTDDSGRTVQVYLVIRESGWTQSYQNTIGNFSQNISSKDAFNYLEPDSWLFDNSALVDLYEGVFGLGSVKVISYEQAVAAHGDVCFAILESMGFAALGPETQSIPWLNVSKPLTH